VSQDLLSMEVVSAITGKTLDKLNINGVFITAASHGNSILYVLTYTAIPPSPSASPSPTSSTTKELAPFTLQAWSLSKAILLWTESFGNHDPSVPSYLTVNDRGDVFVSVGNTLKRLGACHGHGKVNITMDDIETTDNFTCICDNGWLAPECALAYCTNTSCGLNSICNSESHQCQCDDTHYGGNCSVFCEVNATCSNHGYCKQSNGVCICNVGMWQGTNCTDSWLQVTVWVLLGVVLVIGFILVGCMIRTSCKPKRVQSGYTPIQ